MSRNLICAKTGQKAFFCTKLCDTSVSAKIKFEWCELIQVLYVFLMGFEKENAKMQNSIKFNQSF